MSTSKTSAKNITDTEMAAHPPVEIGTRGTVGYLVTQEIEYFSRRDSSKKPHLNHVTDVAASSSSQSIPTQKKKKKKKRGGSSSKLLPSMCSMVEVSENKPVGNSGFSYRNLKSDM
ncbi:hypothetical protein PTKIN_Ptkin14bG0054100 [Pterospermum kingtungense]